MLSSLLWQRKIIAVCDQRLSRFPVTILTLLISKQSKPLLRMVRATRAKDLLEASFPNLLLSPQAHLLASQIARADGDEELAAIEGLYAVICLEGILRSGDGNSSQPYLVTRPSDEYDLLVYLDKRVTGQRLKQQGDRQFELLVLDDGSEIWFDVSVAFGTN